MAATKTPSYRQSYRQFFAGPLLADAKLVGGRIAAFSAAAVLFSRRFSQDGIFADQEFSALPNANRCGRESYREFFAVPGLATAEVVGDLIFPKKIPEAARRIFSQKGIFAESILTPILTPPIRRR